MEILSLLISLIVYGLVFYCSFKVGYNKRKKEWQENSITFTVGKENALYVEHKDGIVKVRVYNPRLVEFIENK